MTDAIRDALEAVVRFTDHYHCKMPTLGADEALAALGDGAREALAALVTPADVGELVERLRKHETYAGDYMLIGEEDKTIRETVAALERVVKERDEWEQRAGEAIMDEAAAIERARKVLDPFAEVASEWDGEPESLHVFLKWNDDGGPVPSLPVAEFRAARRFLEETK